MFAAPALPGSGAVEPLVVPTLAKVALWNERHMDPASVKDILGHADLATTERYLHARASLLAGAATRAFTPSEPQPVDALVATIRGLSTEERSRLLAELGV